MKKIRVELVFRGAQQECAQNPNEISTLPSELVFRQIPGELVQRWGRADRRGSFVLVANCESMGRSVAGVAGAPSGLRLSPASFLAVRSIAGVLAVADSVVWPEPSPAHPARSLPGIGHPRSSSLRPGGQLLASRGGSVFASAEVAPSFSEIYRVLKADSLCVSFYGWNVADLFLGAWRAAGFRPVGQLVWAKDYASSQRYVRHCHEGAYLLAKGRPALPSAALDDVQPWEYTGNQLHPTEKPVSALLPLVAAFTQPGDVVLDPFCGAGSTLVAAEQLGRRYIGIELSGQYCRIAEQRL